MRLSIICLLTIAHLTIDVRTCFPSLHDMRLRHPAAAIFALLFAVATCRSDSESPNESVSVTAVNVYLVATDTRNQFVRDLQQDEIEIHENGLQQSIMGFTNFARDSNQRDAQPLNVAFLLDLSESMNGSLGNSTRFDVVRGIALHMLSELRTVDQMMLVGFSRLPNRSTGMTTDKEAIREELLAQKPGADETGLFDSLYIVLEQMENLRGRKIIILCSDGEDTSSHVKLEQLVDQIQTSDATILAFGIPPDDQNSTDTGKYTLNKLAAVSGGYAFFPTSASQIKKVIGMLGEALHSQYAVWYSPVPKVSDGSWRNIQILCKRPGVDLRYREGYFAK